MHRHDVFIRRPCLHGQQFDGGLTNTGLLDLDAQVIDLHSSSLSMSLRSSCSVVTRLRLMPDLSTENRMTASSDFPLSISLPSFTSRSASLLTCCSRLLGLHVVDDVFDELELVDELELDVLIHGLLLRELAARNLDAREEDLHRLTNVFLEASELEDADHGAHIVHSVSALRDAAVFIFPDRGWVVVRIG